MTMDKITTDEAINECLKLGAQGISLGLAKQLQAERDTLRAQLAEWKESAQRSSAESGVWHGRFDAANAINYELKGIYDRECMANKTGSRLFEVESLRAKLKEAQALNEKMREALENNDEK